MAFFFFFLIKSAFSSESVYLQVLFIFPRQKEHCIQNRRCRFWPRVEQNLRCKDDIFFFFFFYIILRQRGGLLWHRHQRGEDKHPNKEPPEVYLESYTSPIDFAFE